ncbi:hypothetical protein Q3C01_36280 [Bradyrhizobium sp. UFLA05-109]
MADMPSGTILNILRAVDILNAWFVVLTILLGTGALTLHGYDLWRVQIRSAFDWLVPGALLLDYRSGHL